MHKINTNDKSDLEISCSSCFTFMLQHTFKNQFHYVIAHYVIIFFMYFIYFAYIFLVSGVWIPIWSFLISVILFSAPFKSLMRHFGAARCLGK